ELARRDRGGAWYTVGPRGGREGASSAAQGGTASHGYAKWLARKPSRRRKPPRRLPSTGPLKTNAAWKAHYPPQNHRDPPLVEMNERTYDGLRKAGMPEE